MVSTKHSKEGQHKEEITTKKFKLKSPKLSQLSVVTKDAFHLSEPAGQYILVAMIISLLIKTLEPDQSNRK